MIRFSLIPDGIIYLPGAEPRPPKIEGPDLSNLEKIIFLIILAIIAVVAVSATVYFYRLIKKQAVKDKSRLLNNQREETVIHINGKDNLRT